MVYRDGRLEGVMKEFKSQAEAEEALVAAIRQMMKYTSIIVRVACNTRSEIHEFDYCYADECRKHFSVNGNGTIQVDRFELPRAVCVAVGTELRSWTTERLKEQKKRGMAAASRQYVERVCKLASELADAG
jgi:hypothetical protein